MPDTLFDFNLFLTMKRSEKLIQTIRERDIKPAPRIYFVLKSAAVWGGFALAVALGAVAFSVILFSIQQTDFDLLGHLSHSRLEFVLVMLPFFWIASLFVFLLIAMSTYKHSGKGYKLTTGRLAGYSAALSILLGTGVFLAGGGRALEQAFGLRVSIYESMQEKKVKIWSMPAQGYLSGDIITASDTTFTLRDFKGKIWTIEYPGAFVAPVVALEPGEKVKMIGKQVHDDLFRADEIRPWGGPGMRMRHQ